MLAFHLTIKKICVSTRANIDISKFQMVGTVYACENGQNLHTIAPSLPLPLLPCTMPGDKQSTHVIKHTQLIFK